MNRGCLRILATASAVAIVLTGAALERRNVVIDDIDRLTANSGSLAQRVAVGERTHGELTSTLADHQARAALDTTLVEARAPFVAAVGTFSTALQSAKGKVDASAAAARVTAAQDAVLAERDRPDVVAAATQTVTAAGGEVTAAVKAYDDEQQRIAEAAAAAAAARNRASSGGGGWSGGGWRVIGQEENAGSTWVRKSSPSSPRVRRAPSNKRGRKFSLPKTSAHFRNDS